MQSGKKMLSFIFLLSQQRVMCHTWTSDSKFANYGSVISTAQSIERFTEVDIFGDETD
jgi:hypothetical protein